jgi:hypothetical protein
MDQAIASRRRPVPGRWGEQPWGVIILLAALLGIRPALSIADGFDNTAPWGQIAVTIGVYTVWVVTVLARRDPSPIHTLALAGAVYGAMVIVANPILWIFLGAPSLPAPAYVAAPIAVIGFNALIGAILGALVEGLRRLQRQ